MAATRQLRIRRTTAITALAAVVAAMPVAAAAAGRSGAPGQVIRDQYIVSLREGVDPAAVAAEYRGLGAIVRHVYDSAIDGFAGRIPSGLVKQLAADERVELVEPDQVVSVTGEQANAPWGLDRVDQRALPLSKSYTYSVTGQGVAAYVLDTGVRSTHSDFGGRVASGYDAVGGTTSEDCHGHGTHVAGTIAGSTYGVAKSATIVPVRVMRCDGSGSWSDVIEGIDWMVQHHPTGTPAVANLSLYGGGSSTTDDAIRRAVADGIVIAVAAGNTGKDACDYSPGRVAEALTVGATDSTDTKRSSSNWGTCLDVFAPGTSIYSALHSSDDAAGYKSGTSMASPHVAGAAALWLENHPGATATEAAAALVESATDGVVQSAGSGSPNRLLFTADSAASTGAPKAAMTVSCSDLTCQFDGSGSSDTDGTITAHTWSFGDGGTATGETVTHAYAAADSYTVVLEVTDDSGATSSVTTTVSVTAPASTAPTAEFTVTCDALTCRFDGGGSSDPDGSIVNFAWDLGDGTTATGPQLDHTFAAGGTYPVTLAVSDDSGATDATSADVTVSGATNAAPTAAFIVSCDGSSCTFDGSRSTDQDGTIASYDWDLGDGASASGPVVQHSYAAGGTYTVTLRVTDDGGATDTATASASVSGATDSVVTAAIDLSAFGGKANDRHLRADVSVTDSGGAGISGATVTVELMRDGRVVERVSDATSSGTVAFQWNNARGGNYTATVVAVVHPSWDGVQSSDSLTK